MQPQKIENRQSNRKNDRCPPVALLFYLEVLPLPCTLLRARPFPSGKRRARFNFALRWL